MTDRRAALVEKVARVIETRQMDHFTIQASAAIALICAEVLEEAAEAVEAEIDEAYTMEDRAKNAARRYAAAAIRALKATH